MLKDNYFGKELKRMILRMRILVRIKQGPVYSYGLMKEFSKGHFAKFFGDDIKNDVYNTIKSLEQSGYISVTTKSEDGRTKKYYKITKRGDAVLSSARKIQKETMKQISGLFE